MLLRDRHAAALLDTIHGDWRESAACGDHDPELFFPIQDDKPGYGARIHAQIQAAKRAQPELAAGTGRHEPAAAYRRNRQRWNPLTLPERIALAPTAWAQRAGRPVLLGTFARPVLP